MAGFSGSDQEDATSLLSVTSVKPTPYTLSKLVRRLRALTLTLLPLEVDPDSINDPTSRVITPKVIAAYKAAAGDFTEALPYCLLRARAEFIWDANHNNADYGENFGRAIACEVLARRIVKMAPPDRLYSIMSTRFQHIQADGDKSDMSSALEMAIDSHSTIFLSSSEAQDVVNSLWKGELVQRNNEHHEIDYVHYSEIRENTFWGRLDISRMSVPRYQNMIRIMIWLFFLVVYSQAVRQPLERLDPVNISLDKWEIILYTMAFAFFLEGKDTHRFYQLLRFVSWRAFSFWNFVSFLTDSIILGAFILRIAGFSSHDDNEMSNLRLKSFQLLSFVAPLIWMKLITVFDGYKYIGTMQICVARMLQESGIFFALLSVVAVGFAQGLYALDAADGSAEPASSIVNVLVQALLQAPDFEKFSSSTAGLSLYYCWGVITGLILLNILISLFSSAYSDIVDDAEAQYLAFFAGKTVGMIRAPDSYVFPAPFNLIEIVFVSPFEFFPFARLSRQAYAALNHWVMGVVFFIPLAMIAVYETTFMSRHAWMKHWWSGNDEGEDDRPEYRDPVVDETDGQGLVISKVPFTELVKMFPNTEQSSETNIVKEIKELRGQIKLLMERLDGGSAGSTTKGDA